MNGIQNFYQALTNQERSLIESLSSPAAIQDFLDGTPYSVDPFGRCPLGVLRERLANCMDGALFAAAALRILGHAPMLVDLLPEPGTDDDHVLAVYRKNRAWGCVAKSNFTGLRSRFPVYRSLRELVMSYFEDFFNADGMMTLRSYTQPVDLTPFDPEEWMTRDDPRNAIENRLDRARKYLVITEVMAKNLTPASEISLKAGMMMANPAGLFKTGK